MVGRNGLLYDVPFAVGKAESGMSCGWPSSSSESRVSLRSTLTTVPRWPSSHETEARVRAGLVQHGHDLGAAADS